MDLWALDFDGVLCDSALETGTTGWRAARLIDSSLPEVLPEGYGQRFAAVRPWLTTGYQSIVMAVLLQRGEDARIAGDLGGATDEFLAAHGLTTDDLKRVFGGARDDWIESDFAGWLALHSFYPGTIAALQRRLADGGATRIVTTKNSRFALALLESAGVAFPDAHLYGLEAGPKVDVLKALQSECDGAVIHFVEDRLKALEAVAADPILHAVRLYLADWGFLTEADRQRGREMARVEVVGVDGFTAALG
jgi:phosphoglycolate phosphatase-like HAD superfamily hydrolase